MAKLTLNDLANLQSETTAVNTINNNNTATETALENTLSRDGTSPNSMGADIDMDGHTLLNIDGLDMNNTIITGLADPVDDTDAVPLAFIGDAPTFAANAAASAAAALISENNAATSETNADASEAAAASSASSASTSATNASNSASSASTSASNASTSETNAANSASSASTSATTATTQATNAATSASSASTSATNAANSATSASTSATNASNSATAAANSAASATKNGLNYNFSTTTTMADPSAGNIRLNNATLASATAMAISANTSDSGNPSIRSFINTWDDSTTTSLRGTLRIVKASAPENFAIYNVTGATTDNTTWLQITLTHVSSSGSLSNTDAVFILFTRTGDAGSGSLSGMSNHGVPIASGASSIASSVALTDGQLLVGQTGADPLAKTLSGDATLAASGALTLANGAGTRSNLGLTIGTNVQAWDTDLDAVAGLSTTGLVTRTGSGTATTRTITGTSNEVTVTNGDGVSGAPTLSIPSTFTLTGKTVTATTQTALDNSTKVATTAYVDTADQIMTQQSKSASYTLVASDAGKHVYLSGGSGQTLTIPANASVAYTIGTVITVINNSGNNWTIAITTDTLNWAPSGSTGSRTLATKGMCTIIKVTSTGWFISGVGLT